MTVQKRSTEKDQNASRLSIRLVEVLYDVKKIGQESKDCINKSVLQITHNGRVDKVKHSAN